jgi:cytochrome c oxidase subunit 2
MKIDVEAYEKAFLSITYVVLVIMFLAILAGVALHKGHIPHPAGRVAPTQVVRTPPFDHPGVTRVGPGRYRAVLVARMWAFQPNQVTVPAGSAVAFDIASTDVVHGFRINGTAVNAMVIPGEITHVEHTFREPGEYLMVCHEYCGIAHQAMFGKVIVTGPAPSATGEAQRGDTPQEKGS